MGKNVRIVTDERYKNVAEDLALALMEAGVSIGHQGKVVAFNAPGDIVIKTADFHKRYEGDVLTMGSPWDNEKFILPFSSLEPIKGVPKPIYDVVWCFPRENWPVAEELDKYFNCFKIGANWKDGVPLLNSMTYRALPYFYSLGAIVLYHHTPYEYGGLSPDYITAVRSTSNVVITNSGPWGTYDELNPGMMTYTSFWECVDVIKHFLDRPDELLSYGRNMNEIAMRECGMKRITQMILRRL